MSNPGDRYSNMGPLTAFGFLVNALDKGKGQDGDVGASFPRSDAEDLSRGARFVPGEVTLARRAGKHIEFVTECGPCCWYWLFPDGGRYYHWDPITASQMKGKDACPRCGNRNINGGKVPAQEAIEEE